MADPQQLQQQVERLNEELNKINDNIESIGNSLDKSARQQFVKIIEKTRVFGEGLSKSKNIAKDINNLSKQLNDLNRRNVSISIERKLAEDRVKAAAAAYNKDRSAGNRLELIRSKYALRNYTLQLQINEAIEDEVRKLIAAAEERKKQTSLSKNLQNSLEKNLGISLDQVKSMFTLAGIMKIIIDAAFNFNKISVQIGKNLGYGVDQANKVTENLNTAARESSNLNFSLTNANEAMSELNASTGLVAEYSADALETQIMLTKQFGLQADEAAGIYKFSVLNNKSASDTNKAMVGAFVAARNQFKVGADFKQVMAEASKVSGQLAANLGYNPGRITKAVVAMKAFGTTLEQTKAQGEALLNFESSLEAELKAELLTGKAINLEKARAAALAGDQVKLAEELSNQGMTLEKFQGMNVLAQKSFAEALGLSADQLSDQLQKQKMAIESGKSLAQITEEEALEAQKRQNIQDKFNAAMLKLQDLIGGLVSGPLGALLDVLGDIIGLVFKIIGPIAQVIGFVLKPLTGLFGGIGGAISGTADDMVGYGARTLITPEGPVALNNNDTVIAGTNLFKGDDVLSFGKGALSLGGGNKELLDKLDQIASRPAVAYIQGERPFADNLGRQSQLFTSGMQNQSKLA